MPDVILRSPERRRKGCYETIRDGFPAFGRAGLMGRPPALECNPESVH
jgi:hypothetical protein